MPKASPDSMLGQAVQKLVSAPVESRGLVCDLLAKTAADPEAWIPQWKEFNHKRPTWPSVAPLLKPVALLIPAQPEFSEEEFTKPGFWTSDNAKLALGIGQKKIWPPTEETVVRPQELNRPATDQKIWEDTDVELLTYSPGQLHYAMQNLLVKDGRWYVSYVHGADGNLWAVSFFWVAGGRRWGLHAGRAPAPDGWGAGYQFLVRDS